MSEPRTYPKTAYELCEQVCDAIEHAPHNYYQEAFAQNPRHIWVREGDTSVKAKVPDEVCGTAFCRAGWMCAIMDNSTDKRTPNQWDDIDLHGPAYRCLTAAGLSGNEIGNLFGGDACGETQYGTPEYIAAGIKGMRTFMEKHAEKLKAHRLEEGWDLAVNDDIAEEEEDEF